METHTTTLKFKRNDLDWRGGYIATTPEGATYHVYKTQRILLGRFGGGTVHTFWQATYTAPGSKDDVKLLVGSKWSHPGEFRSNLSDTKRLAVVAAEAHANGAGNEQVDK